MVFVQSVLSHSCWERGDGISFTKLLFTGSGLNFRKKTGGAQTVSN